MLILAIIAGLVGPITKEGAPARPASQVESPAAKAMRYCIETATTGSRMKRRSCFTRKEWLDRGFDPLAPAE